MTPGKATGVLLRQMSFQHLRLEPFRHLFALLGMVLGIAVYVAIRLSTESALASLAQSVEAVTGEADCALTSRAGRLPEELIARVRTLPVTAGVSAQSVRYLPAFAAGEELGTVEVLGVDFLANRRFKYWDAAEPVDEDPRYRFVDMLRPPAKALASPELKARAGSTITLRADGRNLDVALVDALPSEGVARAFGGRVLVLDLSQYQELFSDYGTVDRIELQRSPDVDPEQFLETVSGVLPENVRIEQKENRLTQAQVTSAAFRLNLTFLSGISLLVGVLLIYHSVSHTVLRRRSEFAVILSLGGSLRLIRRLLLLESVLLGAVASLLGLLAGYLLAQWTLGLVTGTFSMLYAPVAVKTPVLSAALLIESLVLGPLIALIAAAIPLLELGRIQPREGFGYQTYEESFRRKLRMLSITGVLLLLLTPLFCREELLQRNLHLGFIAPALLVFGVLLVVPHFLYGTIVVSRALLGRGGSPAILLSLDHIEMTLRRNAVAAASMVMALGMALGVSLMIVSFRHTVSEWINAITQADLYISANPRFSQGAADRLPPEVVEFIAAQPDVEALDWVATRRITYEDRPVKVAGIRFETLADHPRMLFKTRLTDADLRLLGDTHDRLLVSEAFANRFHVGPGSIIEIPGIHRSHRGTIEAVFVDFSTELGVVYLPDDVFFELFEDSRVDAVSLYLRDPAGEARIESALAQQFPELYLGIRRNRLLKEEVLRIFDQTFQVTFAIRFVALVVAGFTVLSTISMLLLERKRELAVLRAIGAGRSLLLRLVASECGILGAVSLAAGIALGMLLAAVLVFFINEYFFAWSLTFVLEWRELLLLSVCFLALALVIGVVTALPVIRRLDASALRYE